MNKEDVLKEISENSIGYAFKRFPFIASYKSALQKVDVIDFAPLFELVSKPFSFIASNVWFIVFAIAYPITFIPATVYYYHKARRMYAKILKEKNAAN